MRLALFVAALAAFTAFAAPAVAQTASEAAAIEEFKRGQAAAKSTSCQVHRCLLRSGSVRTLGSTGRWSPEVINLPDILDLRAYTKAS